jgi:NAD(P)H-binding
MPKSATTMEWVRPATNCVDRLFFRLILRDQISDTELQEQEVRASGLDWVLVQPVHLIDGPDGEFFASTDGEVRQTSISRKSVGRFLVEATLSTTYVGKSIALSAA